MAKSSAREGGAEPTDDLEELAVTLVETARALTRAAARAAGPGERRALTGAQMDVLLDVAQHPDQTVSQLADRLQLARNTISTLIGQLTRAGLIERSDDRQDARITRLSLSAVAAERMAGWRTRRAAAVHDALAALSARDLAAVRRAVGPMRSLITAVDPSPDRRHNGQQHQEQQHQE
jgi:DNA-binding MarR family transcriptional regulator